jgi:hypothetical protein
MLKGFLGRKVATQCATCRFWQPDEEMDEIVLGECVKRSSEREPAAPCTTVSSPVVPLLLRQRPVTESRDWCVAWKE